MSGPASDDLSSSEQGSSDGAPATNAPIYESTRLPATESNESSDKVTEGLVDDNATTTGIGEESGGTTAYPISSEGVSPAAGDQPIGSESSSSSEANRYTFTTREFDRSTTVLKEEEIVTKFVEEAASTARPAQGSTEQPNEGVTDIIYTPSERITEFPSIKETSEGTSISNEAEKFASTPVTEEAVTSQSGIPGEGSCLVDGITYPNTSVIESSNPCHDKCVCLSSIPTCTLVICQPAPSDPKCMPVQIKPESCCPVYVCSKLKS